MANPQTVTFGIDNSAYVNVTCRSGRCKRILVQENYDSANPPTDDFLAKAPSTATGVRVAKGTPFVFTPQSPHTEFGIGQIVGAVKAANSSITMQQIESNQI